MAPVDIPVRNGEKTVSQKKSNKYVKRHHKKKSPWPLIVMLTGALLLVFGAIFLSNRPEKPKTAIEITGSPSLSVDQETIDLGEVKLGQQVSVSFQVTNVGDQTLRFSEAPYIEIKEGC